MFEQAPSKCPESPARRNDAALCAAPGRPHCDPGSRASPLVLGLVLFAAACSFESGSDDPPRVALDPADRELARFLDDLLDAALTNPGDAEARGRLAIGYEMNDFDDAAVVAYRQAEALDPREFRWPYFLALLAAGQGNPEAALVSLDRALALDADYAPAWLWKASLLRDLGDDDAGTAYRRARELGEEVHAVVGLAQLALRRSRPDDALALLESVERADWHPQVFRTLGRAYQALGRTDDARIAMARGRDPEPLRWQDPPSRHEVALHHEPGRIVGAGRGSHEGQGLRDRRFDPGTAAGSVSRRQGAAWQSRHPPTDGWAGHARLSMCSGTRSPSIPEHWPFHNAMATVLEETGDRDRARDHLEQSLELNPAQAWVHEKLGRMWMENGDYDKALARFHDAVQYGIDKPATVLHLAGSFEGARERWQEAIAYFERAVALDESHAAAYVHLALCLAEVGRLDEATAALDLGREDRNATAGGRRRTGATRWPDESRIGRCRGAATVTDAGSASPPHRIRRWQAALFPCVALCGCSEPQQVATPWFAEEARTRGIDFAHRSGFAGRPLLPEITGSGVALADLDGDGDLDAYLVQAGSLWDGEAEAAQAGNRLFMNDGTGRFVEAEEHNASDTGYGMGVAAGDYDNDGDVDLYVTNVGPNVLLRNQGNAVFEDVSAEAGVADAGWSTSAAFLDLDADGDLDLAHANYINWSRDTEMECYLGSLLTYCPPLAYNSPTADPAVPEQRRRHLHRLDRPVWD